jgi:hypothetical protein
MGSLHSRPPLECTLHGPFARQNDFCLPAPHDPRDFLSPDLERPSAPHETFPDVLLAFAQLHRHTILGVELFGWIPPHKDGFDGYIVRWDERPAAIDVFEDKCNVFFIDWKLAGRGYNGCQSVEPVWKGRAISNFKMSPVS